MRTSFKNCYGNALFLILIAVALFAALSYAVTQSGRGEGNIDRETASLHASQIVQYAASLRHAVMRMQLVDQVDDADFCFADENWEAGTEANVYDHDACDETKNHVFHTDGGGVAWSAPDPQWMEPQDPQKWSETRWIYTGDINVVDVGTSEPELLAFLGPVKEEICKDINASLGIDNSSAVNDYVCCGWDVAKLFGISTPRYNHDTTIGDQDPAFAGHETGCGGTGQGNHYFWQVLISR